VLQPLYVTRPLPAGDGFQSTVWLPSNATPPALAGGGGIEGDAVSDATDPGVTSQKDQRKLAKKLAALAALRALRDARLADASLQPAWLRDGRAAALGARNKKGEGFEHPLQPLALCAAL
jgi:hypothetical protein